MDTYRISGWTIRWRKDEVLSQRRKNTHYFLCGNPGMILSMLKHLEAEGFQEHKPKQPGQVHVERYW